MAELLVKYNNVVVKQAEVAVLEGVNMEVRAGDFIYIMGKVGCGKSSLLSTIYAELPIADGEGEVMGYSLAKLKRSQMPALRRKLGIVFQDFRLLSDRTVYENMLFVLRATGWKDKVEIDQRIEDTLKRVGMETKGYKRPNELSGGEQQRIVIARAILNKPALLLADEPTGNLDPDTGKNIVELLHSLASEGTAILMTTHNPLWAEQYPATKALIENHHLTISQAT